MKFITRIIPFLPFLPVLAFAQGELTEVTSFLDNIVKFINGTVVPLIFAIAFLTFIWGIFNYFILSKDAEEAKKAGKDYMLAGIAGFVIMVSVWGIVNLVANGFGFAGEDLINIPDVKLRNN